MLGPSVWLFMAVWLTGHDPHSYKIVAEVGPFETYKQCWAAGALSANAIQIKDGVSNALGACKQEGTVPAFLDMKSMWDRVCATYGLSDLCWLKNGKFVDPIPKN